MRPEENLPTQHVSKLVFGKALSGRIGAPEGPTNTSPLNNLINARVSRRCLSCNITMFCAGISHYEVFPLGRGCGNHMVPPACENKSHHICAPSGLKGWLLGRSRLHGRCELRLLCRLQRPPPFRCGPCSPLITMMNPNGSTRNMRISTKQRLTF